VILALITFHPTLASADPIKFEIQVLDDAGHGFNDPILGAQRLNAFQFAANLWGSFFVSSFPGETVRVGVQVGPLLNFEAFTSTVNFLTPSVAIPISVLDHLLRSDFAPNRLAGTITFNEQSDFFLGIDGNPGDRLDFVTFALHELGHVFGFISFLNPAGTYDANVPSVYDLQVEDQFGNLLVDRPPEARLAAATSGNGLFWGGADGVAGNGGIRPNLSAGTTFLKGSNVVHLSNAFGPGNLLMDAVTDEGQVIRTLSPVERGMFQDLFWTLAPTQAVPEPSTLVLLSIGLVALLAYAWRKASVG
jgi:hypothetical protein